MNLIYKQKGQTPLEALEVFRMEYSPQFDATPLSYAGRLDPMAEGLLLVLIGEKENRERETYLHLDKTYEVEVLFGLESDTYDVLGEIQIGNPEKGMAVDLEKEVKEFLKSIEGEFVQPYPPYSSKPVQGRPLFEWARAGKLGEIEIPTRLVHIYEAKMIGIHNVPVAVAVKQVIQNIKKAQGDFRQEQCIESWRDVAKKYSYKNFLIANIEVSCQSGTYMRSICHELGKKVGSYALAFNIRRTKIGKIS